MSSPSRRYKASAKDSAAIPTSCRNAKTARPDLGIIDTRRVAAKELRRAWAVYSKIGASGKRRQVEPMLSEAIPAEAPRLLQWRDGPASPVPYPGPAQPGCARADLPRRAPLDCRGGNRGDARRDGGVDP